MEEARANVDVDKHERGFTKIAWAFLKVLQNIWCCHLGGKTSLHFSILLFNPQNFPFIL